VVCGSTVVQQQHRSRRGAFEDPVGRQCCLDNLVIGADENMDDIHTRRGRRRGRGRFGPLVGGHLLALFVHVKGFDRLACLVQAGDQRLAHGPDADKTDRIIHPFVLAVDWPSFAYSRGILAGAGRAPGPHRRA
jgi:hypothetical protein